MNAQQIRKAYIDFFVARQHQIIPRALLVPQNDSSTLFTGSGMQPLVPYLLGAEHPNGTRLVDSQPVFRAQDIEEVGDNRHDTLFEMLGNWSLGDYFKAEQLPWIWEFFTKEIGLDPKKLYVTCFIGDEANKIPRDLESSAIWRELYAKEGIEAKEADLGSEASAAERGVKPGERIFYYDVAKNWWSRSGKPNEMPVGEPGGTTSEVFYEFDFVEHNPEYGAHCHPNCDCGRFVEIGNNVFMEYVKHEHGFEKLPKQNVDCGVGLERTAMAAIDNPDVFKISILWPIIEKLEVLSGKRYDANTNAMRVIADHLRAASFLAVDGVVPSNKEQGYVMRRLVRRAIARAFDLGIEQNFLEEVVPIVADLYAEDYPEVKAGRDMVVEVLTREEKLFRQTLRKGLRFILGYINKNETKDESGVIVVPGSVVFEAYDTFGYPPELTEELIAIRPPMTKKELEESNKLSIAKLAPNWREDFNRLMEEQKARSRTATKGEFKGGLADHSEVTTKYHTATHLMYRALRMVLGDHVIQRGSNITGERLRFDFSHSEKVTPEQIAEVEKIVNEQIDKDWPVSWREENTKQALASGVMGAFGDKYGESVKVYTVGDPDGVNYSREICGGPHVEHTGVLKDGGKRFKVVKEEASSAGVRRIKAELA
ncbi:MAG TPA: alanine--tRNA ligase [Patescibacteria group bacterium]|nr:alanine--tRNA ligase [Patescibacteria group bacterium]